MDLSNLKPAEGSTKSRKRVGRGQGSGRGGTSTRGHNGQKSRSGYSKKIGFEGGQMPLQKRVPKFGFTNINRVSYKAVNLYLLEAIAEKQNLTVIDRDVMISNGLLAKKQKVKVLCDGGLSRKLDITADAFSAKAIVAIESKGGKAVKIS